MSTQIRGTTQVLAGTITETELSTSVAGNGLTGGGGTALAVNLSATGGLQIAADALGIKLDGSTLSLGASGLKLATPVGVTIGGTGLTTIASGGLLYGSALDTLSVRTIGSSGDILTVSGGFPTWAPPAAAATSTITDDTTTDATMYPVWVTAATGSLPLKVSSTKLSLNPSTGTLTASVFAGSGASLTSLPAGQLSGTITSSVQDNITRLGTLTNGPGGFTAGSIVFHNGTTLAQDNANLFWDDSGNRLAVGTNAPLSGRILTVKAAGTGIPFELISSGGVHSVYIRPDRTSTNLISSDFLSGAAYLPLALSGREDVTDFVLDTGIVRIGGGQPGAGTYTLVFGDGTAPSSLAANTAALYADDDGSGNVRPYGIHEDGVSGPLGIVYTKSTTGDPTGREGLFVINTFDNTFKVYADAGWRTLASGW